MRQRLYAFINIFGLALGIACCMLMALFVKHEWSYDQFHHNKDHLYRLVAQQTKPDGEQEYSPMFQHKTVADLKNNLPSITHATTFIRARTRIENGERKSDERVGLVSEDFLTMFTFPLLAGDPTTALNRPNTIVLSETAVYKLFDAQLMYDDIIGQPVELNGITAEVTGIIADVPKTSSLHFTVLIHADHYGNFGINYWDGGYTEIYMQLSEEQAVENLQDPLHSFANTHLTKRIQNLVKWKEIPNSDAYKLTLQPLGDVYWNTEIKNPYAASGNWDAVLNLWGLTGLILLIACSNFTTLSIANSAGRALEVGLRKVLGANRKQVMQQFWSEALILSFIGLFLAIALAELFLPIFNELIQKELHISYFEDSFFLLLLLGIVTVVGLLSGSYPATILSRFQPITTLKGENRVGGGNYLTKSLIILQYTASITLMICIGVMDGATNLHAYQKPGL